MLFLNLLYAVIVLGMADSRIINTIRTRKSYHSGGNKVQSRILRRFI